MIQWILNHILWFAIRIVVTLACIFTVHNVIASEGYRIEYKDLLVSTVCLIIVTRFWAPKQTKEREIDHV